jgi:hypothetical protein
MMGLHLRPILIAAEHLCGQRNLGNLGVVSGGGILTSDRAADSSRLGGPGASSVTCARAADAAVGIAQITAGASILPLRPEE